MTASVAGAQAIIAFDFPAAPAASCLRAIGAQARVTIGGDAQILAGMRCAGVKGRMTVAEAIRRALGDSAATVVQAAPTVFRIVARPVRVPISPPATPVAEEPVWPEILVVAHSPILWRVARGASEIIILGTVTPMPVQSDWSRSRVQHYLHGARRLLVAPQPRAGLLVMEKWSGHDAAGLFLPRGQDLETSLLPAQSRRFLAAREKASQPAKRYAALRPAIAAMLLLDDWRRGASLVTAEPARTVEQMARRQGVPVQRIDPVSDLPTLDQLPGLTEGAQRACLDHILANIEAENARWAMQVDAWLKGDVEELKRSYLPPATCSGEIPGDRERRQKASADWDRALEEALSLPGRTFAVVDVTTLLTPGGIVAKLRSRGAEVTVLSP